MLIYFMRLSIENKIFNLFIYYLLEIFLLHLEFILVCTDEHMNLSPFNYGGGLIVFVDKRCIIIIIIRHS